MRRIVVVVLALVLIMLAGAGPVSGVLGTAASSQEASSSGCAGSWLLELSIEERPIAERVLAKFEPDGQVVTYSTSVVPPLPGTVYDRLFPSPGMGQWEPSETDRQSCSFDFFRLLADEEGYEIGTAYFRGTLTVEPDGATIGGAFTFAQSMPYGKTIASGEGTIDGRTILIPRPISTPTATSGMQAFG